MKNRDSEKVHEEAARLVEEALRVCLMQDIDFLDSGNSSGEFEYIRFMRAGYERSVAAVLENFSGDNLERRGGIRILETASYLGVVAIALAKAGFSVTATDIPEYINHPKILERYAKNSIESVALNLRAYPLPWENESFDVVLAAEVLEHLNFNPVPLLVEINRILKEGGGLYIATPNAVWLPKRVRFLMGKTVHDSVSDFFMQLEASNGSIVGMHWREYTKSELEELLKKSGFSLLRHSFCRLAATNENKNFLRALILRKIYESKPDFLPGQALWASKSSIPKITIKFTESTAANHDLSHSINQK